MLKVSTRIAAGVAAVALMLGASAAGAQDVTRAITKIAGDLYRFQNNFHFSVFLVTDEGIIATDPINAAAATWLKGELQARFNQPVRYLIYSHDHADHISGGEVFADTAVVVAHERARADIVGENRPTAVPDITFSDELVIELGGKTVEVSHVGRNHSDNSVVVHFPDERTLFAVDFIPVGQVLFRDLPDSYIDEWIESIKTVETMDFDILAPGHGALGDMSDATQQREYLETLRAAVLEQLRLGKSVEETQTTVLAQLQPRFGKLGQFADWAPLNVAGMYQYMSTNRRGN